MKNYLFTISEEEKQNILDKHKTVYNGYATNQISSNTQPLYTQDFANDKGGITVKNDGTVSTYNNKIYMKEEKSTCSKCGLYEEVCECGYKKVEGIGNKFDYVEMEEDEKSDDMLSNLSDELEDDLFDEPEFDKSEFSEQEFMAPKVSAEEDECNECGGTYEEEWKEEVEYEGDIENIEESIQESLNWFKRFKKYN
jgi:hypothetical protein